LEVLLSGFFVELLSSLTIFYFIWNLVQALGDILADIVISNAQTDYTRILRAIYGFAQVM
jgi:hypothetical protein